MSRHWPGKVAPWEREDDAPADERTPLPWIGAAVVAIFALALWFPYPGTTYWASDDYLAMHYASDLGRALGDFAHNQYDIGGAVWFYRPLITLSFWIDNLLGAVPWISHLSNALAHAMSAVFVVLLASRCAAPLGAVFAGLVWAAAPAHVGSLLWAVGRVDSHTTPWILLTVWCAVRWMEYGRWMRLTGVLAFAMALCSKESALVVPGVVGVVTFAMSQQESVMQRLRVAWVGTWPYLATLGAYFVVRFAALGRLGGGYQAEPEATAILAGLGEYTLRWLDPLRYAGDGVVELPEWTWLAGLLPIVIALGILLARRRLGLIATMVLLYVGACVPLYQLLPNTGDTLDLRVLYLPSVALTILMCSGSWIPGLLTLLVFALPFVETRQAWAWSADVDRQTHAHLVDVAKTTPEAPTFVHGLPRQSGNGVLSFHIGVDRLLRPPFSDDDRRLFALRPLSQTTTTHTIPYGDETGLPHGVTLGFHGPEILGRIPAAQLPRLETTVEGPLEFGNQRLHELAHGQGKSSFVVMPHRTNDVYRITLFTAGGYLSAVLADDDGRIDLAFDMLFAQFDRANTADLWAQALRTPTAIDLEPRFPLLVESGRWNDTPAGRVFAPQAVADRFIWLEYDRNLADWLDGIAPE